MAKIDKKNVNKTTDFLFPPTLEHKKIRLSKTLLKPQDKETKSNIKALSYLSDYLTTKNPLSLANAIKVKPELLHGYLKSKSSSLDVDLFLEVKDKLDKSHSVKRENYIDEQHGHQKRLLHRSRKYVDMETVVKESLNWWREIQNFTGTYEEAEIAKKYLDKIAPVVTFKRNETVITEGGEFLIHIDDMGKHAHPCVTYISPTEFICRWEKVYSAFNRFRSKKRYRPHADEALKKSDALKAIRFLGNELSDYEVNKLDLSNTGTKTASYMRIFHQDRCPVCKKEGLSNSMILRRLSDARKELILSHD